MNASDLPRKNNDSDSNVKGSDSNVKKGDGFVIKMSESQKYDQAVRTAVESLSLTLVNLDAHAESIAESLEILAEYHLRKGRQEGMFAPDEYEPVGDEEEEEAGIA